MVNIFVFMLICCFDTLLRDMFQILTKRVFIYQQSNSRDRFVSW